MRTNVPSGLWAVCVVALRNSGKEVEGGKLDLARCTVSLVLGSHKKAIQLSSLDAFALMSSSRMAERFWYNLDIQVISREVDDKFLEI